MTPPSTTRQTAGPRGDVMLVSAYTEAQAKQFVEHYLARGYESARYQAPNPANPFNQTWLVSVFGRRSKKRALAYRATGATP